MVCSSVELPLSLSRPLGSILRFSLPLRLRHRSEIDSFAVVEARRAWWGEKAEKEEERLLFSLSTPTSKLFSSSSLNHLRPQNSSASKLRDLDIEPQQQKMSSNGGDTYTPKCVLVTGQSLLLFF